MATKTWIGTTTGWGTASNWSPAAIPTATDDLIFNNSANCIPAASSVCNSIDFTGYTGTLSGTNGITISGSTTGTSTGISLRLSSGMTITYTGGITFSGSAGGYIYSNGKTILSAITFNNAAGVWSTQDVLTTTGALTVTTGTFNINADLTIGSASAFTHTAGTINANNGANITCGSFVSSNSNVRTLNMGSGTWALKSTATVWNLTTTTNITFNAQQSRILINNTTAPTTLTSFIGGGLTYYTVEYARGAATANFNITGNNTFTNFIDNTSTVAHSVVFGSASTQSFYKFNVMGSPGALVSILTSLTVVSIVKLGQGIVNCNYISATTGNTSASPANTWYRGANSTGASTGWVTTAPLSSQSLLGVGGVG